MARLVLLICVLILAGCQTSLGDHLPTSPDALTVYPQQDLKEVRTSMRIKREDYANLTSFPDMVESQIDLMGSETVKFSDRAAARARPWGGAFAAGSFATCDPCCHPSEHAPRFSELSRSLRRR